MPIIDFYDDPQGHQLRTKMEPETLPDFIKIAAFHAEDELDALPDDAFALVMVDQHSKMRKYACTDKGNTALSVIYFLENHDNLSEDAQKVAAANLLTACGWYKLEPPTLLQKLAKCGKKMTKGAESKDYHYRWDPDHPKNEEFERDVASWSSKENDDFPGTMKKRYGISVKKVQGPLHITVTHKTASIDPYVDITGKQAPPRIVKVAAKQTLLNGHFPIDTYGEVEQAQKWFGEYGTTLHPADRREYCIKLAAQAERVGVELSDGIQKYASKTYAPDGEIKVAVHTRLQFWAEDSPERDMLKGLLEKQAQVPPEVFAEALRLFDETTGLDQRWDEAVYDPYYSTYGFQKKADWSFVSGNDRITAEQLHDLVKYRYKAIKCTFGEEIADELRKKPRAIFDSLPLDSKRIIMRMGSEEGRKLSF